MQPALAGVGPTAGGGVLAPSVAIGGSGPVGSGPGRNLPGSGRRTAGILRGGIGFGVPVQLRERRESAVGYLGYGTRIERGVVTYHPAGSRLSPAPAPPTFVRRAQSPTSGGRIGAPRSTLRVGARVVCIRINRVMSACDSGAQ